MIHKFRGMRIDSSEWVYGDSIESSKAYIVTAIGKTKTIKCGGLITCTVYEVHPDSVGMWTGLKDKNEIDWYHKDIGEFPNGDRFVIAMEEWVEFFVDWIGEPECEDQARDFYRIRNAVKIGSIHQNPDLLST